MWRKVYTLILYMIFLLSCGNEQVEEIHPSEYSWAIDTLELDVVNSRFKPTDILYVNDNDLYVFGETGYYNLIYWHYNGTQWRDTIIYTKANDIVAVERINGKIYGVGDTRWDLPDGVRLQGGVERYSNRTWEQQFHAHVDGQLGTRFNDIWGSNLDDIWAGGYYGLLYHYNGLQWGDYCLPDSIHILNFSGTDTTGLYAIGYYLHDNKINGYLLKLISEDWVIEDQFNMDYSDYLFRPFGHLDLFVTEDYIYSCGDGVYRKTKIEDHWEKLWQFSIYKFWDASGSSHNNIYFVGEGGNVVYWDGSMPYSLDTICYPEITYKKSWTDGKQVIIAGYSESKTYIMWGK